MGYTVKQLRKKIENDEMILHENGHLVNPIKDYILQQLDAREEAHNSMATRLREFIGEKIKIGTSVPSFMSQGAYCFNCGDYLTPVLVKENEIGLYPRDITYDMGKPLQLPDNPTCEILPIQELGYIETQIDVPSGELIFTNFFRKEEIYSLQGGYNSINAVQGRIKLANYLAEKNVGYGQMGNMSCGVFINEKGDEIIIGETYLYKEEDDEESEVTFDGFKCLGKISLDVWRWMCADKEILIGHGEELPEEGLKPQSYDGEEGDYYNYFDYINCKVKSGKWNIQHFYDFSKEDDLVYSKLKLISEQKL